MIFFNLGIQLLYHIIVLMIHEFAHAEVAKRRGYRLTRMRLMPYGAQLSGDFNTLTVRDEVLIALAGPVANLITAAAFVAIWWLAPSSFLITESLVYISLYTAIFNLLPLYPLDGGRVLLAALSAKYRRAKVYKVMRIIGFIAAVMFAALFFATFYVVANLSLAFIALFFFMSTMIPDKNATYGRLYAMAYRSEKLKKGLPVKEIMVSADTTILSLLRMLNVNYFYKFTIVDHNFKQVVQINELQLEDLATRLDTSFKVGTCFAK